MEQVEFPRAIVEASPESPLKINALEGLPEARVLRPAELAMPPSTPVSLTSCNDFSTPDVDRVLQSTAAGLKQGLSPILVEDGTGGVYYVS